MADLASGYNILEKIGTGAKSLIYKVVDPSTGQNFAIKRVVREPDEDTRFLEQAITEYEISREIDHPALRRIFDLKRFRSWGRLTEVHVVMEYVQGVSLEQHRPTDMAETVQIFIKVAEGLDAMHRAGFLHTDLKPNNILVCSDSVVKIIDFGQSCPVLTRKKRIQGTPDYIAPEQVHREPLTARTDVFNLGATMYWVLTGKAYPTIISKNSQPGAYNVVAPRQIPAPHEVNPLIPVGLSRLVMESCQEQPIHRPRDMRTVITRLEAVQQMLGSRPADAAAPAEAADPPPPAAPPPEQPRPPSDESSVKLFEKHDGPHDDVHSAIEDVLLGDLDRSDDDLRPDLRPREPRPRPDDTPPKSEP